MSEQNHPWCRDVSRDEAIRAAEDAAAAGREPLPDHRDLPLAVHDLRRRLEGLETVADAWRRQCEADAENCEAAPGSRAGVSDTGLRTERVTLKITFRRGVKQVSASSWDWFQIVHDGHGLQDLESVRVVEEADDQSDLVRSMRGILQVRDSHITSLTAERDAALRERDAAKQECALLWQAIGLATTAVPSSVITADDPIGMMRRVAARVAELESAPASNAGVEQPQPPSGWLTEEEREAVERAAHVCYQSGRMGSGHISDILRAIIARSTPPRVKVPHKDDVVDEYRDRQWIAAIRAAGGEVAQ